jgi:Cu-Zn family superoxide dismutase
MFGILIGVFVLGVIALMLMQIHTDSVDMAVAVFKGDGGVIGEVTFKDERGGCRVTASFTALPQGEHGFHIHEAGDLRGEGCKAACSHYHKGAATRHGGAPGSAGSRHTGDLGNIAGPTANRTYFLSGVRVSNLWGRSVIIHADPDDLGLGGHDDSHTTGHSGTRIACALIGRVAPCADVNKTRKKRRS